MSKRPLSEAQKKASEKYVKANYDEIKVRVPKGKKESIKVHVDLTKESLSAFINRAIDETMEHDDISPTALLEKKPILQTS